MVGGKHLAQGSDKPELPDDGIMRLFSMRFCPFAQRVHLVLNYKKLDFHAIYINLTEKPEWFQEFSPLGKVPALQLIDQPGRPTLIESLVIVEYLDEKFPEKPLLAKDALQRALDKILVERFSVDVIPHFYKVAIHGDESALTKMTVGLDIFEAELKKRGTVFFHGDKPGFVDYMIWPWCERTDSFSILVGEKYVLDDERFKHLLKWREQMLADEVVKSFYLTPEIHAKYLTSRRENQVNYDMLLNPAKRQRTN